MASFKQYKDLNLDFLAHPITKDLTPLKNEVAIKRSLRNLIQMNFFDVPFSPDIGSNLRKMLFEPVNYGTAINIENEIRILIRNWEPRVEIQKILVTADFDVGFYNVTIGFNIVNVPTDLEVSVRLNKIRG